MAVARSDRLSALDATFLHIEDHGSAHMHVASVMTFKGTPPTYDELLDHVTSRLHLVPRYRRRLAYVPLGQGRPVWVDDPHFNPRYHIRHSALPRPGDEQELRALAGRLFSQRLDRSKPLWELWLVERLSDGRFALIAKTHHSLVDGITGADLTSVLFDESPNAPPTAPPPQPWAPQPLPGPAKLLADALLERSTNPDEMRRGAHALVRGPRHLLGSARDGLAAVGASALAGISAPAPPSPFNTHIGPHRRYTWVDADLAEFKAIKDVLGGTLNDVLLCAVTLALGSYLRSQGHDTTNLVLKALVPVSVVHGDSSNGSASPSNDVLAAWADLPVGLQTPAHCFDEVHLALEDLAGGDEAIGAGVLADLAGFAPSTILSQAARLQARERQFNVTVINVPGPQQPRYLIGRRMLRVYPVVPLGPKQTLGISVMSYAGHLGFGLLGDYDALPGLELIADSLRKAIRALATSAGVKPGGGSRTKRSPARRGATPA